MIVLRNDPIIAMQNFGEEILANIVGHNFAISPLPTSKLSAAGANRNRFADTA